MLRVALGGGGADYSAGDMFKTEAGEGELRRYIINSFGAGRLADGLAEVSPHGDAAGWVTSRLERNRRINGFTQGALLVVLLV